jgi:hypothetical protein
MEFLLTLALISTVGQAPVLVSVFSQDELDLTPDPAAAVWAQAPAATADRDYFGERLPGRPTEIRSRWTTKHLYLLYSCPYTDLNLKPNPDRSSETPKLWTWDVAEAFIGSDFDRIGRYKEFQVSPQGEWIDLDIDRENPKGQAGAKWDSGFTVAARIDAQAKIWYGIMRIPFEAIDSRAPQKGRELRAGLYRIAGAAPDRLHYAWSPTGQTSFHVPKAFGTIRLE